MKVSDIKIGDKFKQLYTGIELVCTNIISNKQYQFKDDRVFYWLSKSVLELQLNNGYLEYIPPVISVEEVTPPSASYFGSFSPSTHVSPATRNKDVTEADDNFDLLAEFSRKLGGQAKSKPECKHEYKHYQGIMEEYDYCVKCDHKKMG